VVAAGLRLVPFRHIADEIAREIAAEGVDWSPLKAGLSAGSLPRAQEVKRALDQFLSRFNMF
jgi:hypothetical protein